MTSFLRLWTCINLLMCAGCCQPEMGLGLNFLCFFQKWNNLNTWQLKSLVEIFFYHRKLANIFYARNLFGERKISAEVKTLVVRHINMSSFYISSKRKSFHFFSHFSNAIKKRNSHRQYQHQHHVALMMNENDDVKFLSHSASANF